MAASAALVVAGRAEGLNAGVTAERTDPRVADRGGVEVEAEETVRVAMAGLEQRGKVSQKEIHEGNTATCVETDTRRTNKTEWML